MSFVKNTYSIFLTGLGFANVTHALPSVIKIEDARYLNQKEIQYFPEKIPTGCTPISLTIYINDEMAKNLKSELSFKNDDFFKKDMIGNKINFIYFPKNCPTKKFFTSNTAVLKIRKEIENWLPFHTPKFVGETK